MLFPRRWGRSWPRPFNSLAQEELYPISYFASSPLEVEGFDMAMASDRLRRAMFELNVTNEELASSIGIFRPYLSSLRSGKDPITARTSAKISRVLNEKVQEERYGPHYFTTSPFIPDELDLSLAENRLKQAMRELNITNKQLAHHVGTNHVYFKCFEEWKESYFFGYVC